MKYRFNGSADSRRNAPKRARRHRHWTQSAKYEGVYALPLVRRFNGVFEKG
jgi:hypothetical protein